MIHTPSSAETLQSNSPRTFQGLSLEHELTPSVAGQLLEASSETGGDSRGTRCIVSRGTEETLKGTPPRDRTLYDRDHFLATRPLDSPGSGHYLSHSPIVYATHACLPNEDFSVM